MIASSVWLVFVKIKRKSYPRREKLCVEEANNNIPKDGEAFLPRFSSSREMCVHEMKAI